MKDHPNEDVLMSKFQETQEQIEALTLAVANGFEAIQDKFVGVEGRFEGIEKRLGGIEKDVLFLKNEATSQGDALVRLIRFCDAEFAAMRMHLARLDSVISRP